MLDSFVLEIIVIFFGGALFDIYGATMSEIENGSLSSKTTIRDFSKFFIGHRAVKIMTSTGLLWSAYPHISISPMFKLAILGGMLLLILIFEPIKRKVQHKNAERKLKKYEEIYNAIKGFENEKK